jgi:hypothetical protein
MKPEGEIQDAGNIDISMVMLIKEASNFLSAALW